MTLSTEQSASSELNYMGLQKKINKIKEDSVTLQSEKPCDEKPKATL